jgi:hypothetical protein
MVTHAVDVMTREPSETPESIGGLNTLKAYIRFASKHFGKEAREYGIDPPRGLITVIQTTDGNMGLAEGFCEPMPRKYGRKVYLKVRSFHTRETVELARDAIKRAGGLAKIVPYTSYGSNNLRLYANANNSKEAYEVINCIYCMGHMWYDGPVIPCPDRE